MKTNFISRYEKALTRQECRDIIEEIEFFDSNSLLFDQNAEEPYLQDQKAINPTVDLCIDLTTAARVTKKIFPKIKPCIDKYLKTLTSKERGEFMKGGFSLNSKPTINYEFDIKDPNVSKRLEVMKRLDEVEQIQYLKYLRNQMRYEDNPKDILPFLTCLLTKGLIIPCVLTVFLIHLSESTGILFFIKYLSVSSFF